MKQSKIARRVLASAASAMAATLQVQADQSGTSWSSQPISPEDLGVGESQNAFDFDQIKSVIQNLKDQIQSDSVLRDRFMNQPREVLSEFGLPLDVQSEIIREEGLIHRDYLELVPLGDCACTSCCATCACTGCCNTSSS